MVLGPDWPDNAQSREGWIRGRRAFITKCTKVAATCRQKAAQAPQSVVGPPSVDTRVFGRRRVFSSVLLSPARMLRASRAGDASHWGGRALRGCLLYTPRMERPGPTALLRFGSPVRKRVTRKRPEHMQLARRHESNSEEERLQESMRQCNSRLVPHGMPTLCPRAGHCRHFARTRMITLAHPLRTARDLQRK